MHRLEHFVQLLLISGYKFQILPSYQMAKNRSTRTTIAVLGPFGVGLSICGTIFVGKKLLWQFANIFLGRFIFLGQKICMSSILKHFELFLILINCVHKWSPMVNYSDLHIYFRFMLKKCPIFSKM